MTPSLRTRFSACLFLLATGSACQSFDVENRQFAIINISAQPDGEGYSATPAAFFFEGMSIRLSTTDVGAEGCVDRPIVPPSAETYTYIDAGSSISLTHAGETRQLVPELVSGRVTYELPGNETMAVTPGDLVTISIPGAIGGFPATLLGTQTVIEFTPNPVTVSRSATGSVELTWQSPTAVAPGSAMFYSLAYAGDGAGIPDREIACVFVDDGTGLIAPSELAGFRASDFHTITAQRARITIERMGSAVAHVTSALTLPVELFIVE